jgi:hypothetical protein
MLSILFEERFIFSYINFTNFVPVINEPEFILKAL